jgi:hypothetical protein
VLAAEDEMLSRWTRLYSMTSAGAVEQAIVRYTSDIHPVIERFRGVAARLAEAIMCGPVLTAVALPSLASTCQAKCWFITYRPRSGNGWECSLFRFQWMLVYLASRCCPGDAHMNILK